MRLWTLIRECVCGSRLEKKMLGEQLEEWRNYFNNKTLRGDVDDERVSIVR